MIELGIGLFVCLSCGYFSYVVAYAKGLKALQWFWMGFFFPLIALLAVIGMPERK